MASGFPGDKVSTTWLKKQLDENNTNNIRVLDVSWSSERDCRPDYDLKHIPGSQHFDIMHKVENTEMFPRNFPSATDFENYAQSLGINTEDHVIVYGTFPGKNGYFIGGRAWLLFKRFGHTKVSILDGGFEKWIQDGFPTSSEVPTFDKGNFRSEVNPDIYKTYEQLTENLNQGVVQVIDSRPPEKYIINDEAKTGHIRDAINIPFSLLMDDDTQTLKSQEKLKTLFEEKGVDLKKPIVTMCNSGMSSCTMAFAAQLLGADSALYHGGWNEYRRKTNNS
ncbi:unnamed protein product [Owenia fusiformis]|uniref:Rhodanese domain-containing protein n=1 Tax=Owenia fusiformis TaxID=6347 RepID=A0A8S4NM85_OWEFU|nr:unnamed protein product [Owenia fusiformis]